MFSWKWEWEYLGGFSEVGNVLGNFLRVGIQNVLGFSWDVKCLVGFLGKEMEIYMFCDFPEVRNVFGDSLEDGDGDVLQVF